MPQRGLLVPARSIYSFERTHRHTHAHKQSTDLGLCRQPPCNAGQGQLRANRRACIRELVREEAEDKEGEERMSEEEE